MYQDRFSVRKHNLNVRIIKYICVFIIISILIMIYWASRNNDSQYKMSLHPSQSKNSTKDLDEKINITKAEFYSSSKNEKPFKLSAKQISQISNTEFSLSSIEAAFLDNKDKEINISSENGIWYEDNRFFKLQGNIIVDIQNKIKIFAPNLNIFLDDYIIKTNDKVEIIGNKFKLNTKGFNIKKNNSKIDFFGPISLKILY